MARKLFFCILLLGLGLSFVPSVDAQTPSAQSPTPVIIDTDMALDDWMAMLDVLGNEEFAVEAITVTGTGFAFCDAGVDIALGLLALTEYGDVPVSCWTEAPLLGDNGAPDEWKTSMEAAEALGLPEGGEPSDLDAVELFSTTVAESSEPVTVLALGPLTNVGAALEADPSLVDNIEMVYVMGGAIDVPGSGITEENTTAEWNIYLDPHSARLTFESGAPITLVPLDATNDAPVTPAFLAELETNQQTPVAEFVFTALSGNIESIESGGYYFWDPLAAGVMSNPDIVTLTEREVTVIDIPGHAEDGRTKPVGNGPTIWVATEPDIETFEQNLIDSWNS